MLIIDKAFPHYDSFDDKSSLLEIIQGGCPN